MEEFLISRIPPIMLTIGQSKMHVQYEQRGNHQYAHGKNYTAFLFLYTLAETRFRKL